MLCIPESNFLFFEDLRQFSLDSCLNRLQRCNSSSLTGFQLFSLARYSRFLKETTKWWKNSNPLFTVFYEVIFSSWMFSRSSLHDDFHLSYVNT